MALALDPEIAAVYTAMAAAGPPPARPAREDWRALREVANTNLALWADAMPDFPDVRLTTYRAVAADGASLELRLYRNISPTKSEKTGGSAVVFAHGGGLVAELPFSSGSGCASASAKRTWRFKVSRLQRGSRSRGRRGAPRRRS